MQDRKRRARQDVVVDGAEGESWVQQHGAHRQQQRQRIIRNEGISCGWRGLLLLAVLSARCAESFQLAGVPQMKSVFRRTASQHVSFIPRHYVRTTKTALLDSERRMDIVISFAKSVVMSCNDTGAQLLMERQLYNALDSSSGTSLSSADVSMPTENGGYSHTAASRAKISAANKGKTPWNKGKQRSEEVKAKIAAGVRAKNRQRFLEKLENLGLTEEEFEAQKKAERRKKDAERRARKTDNGGFRPTDETRQKISQVLKERYAKGEIKRREVDPTKVRRGFVHSPETRQKISESLKKRWATDGKYRETMRRKTMTVATTSDEVRKRISDTLKRKWEDPEFRAAMLEKIRSRTGHKTHLDKAHKEKISKSMKELWKDEDYRQKVAESFSKRAEIMASIEPKKPKKIKVPLKEQSKKASFSGAKPGSFKTSIDSILGDNENTPIPSSSPSSLTSVMSGSETVVAQPLQPKVSVGRTTETPGNVDRSSSTSMSPSEPPTMVADVALPVVVQVPSPPAQIPRKKKKASTVLTKTRPAEPRIVSTTSGTHGRKKEPVVVQTAFSTTRAVNGVSAAAVETAATSKMTTATKTVKEEGSVSRLREERRDLYDLLYGEEEPGTFRTRSKLGSIFELDDENLDTFDPYGLDDF